MMTNLSELINECIQVKEGDKEFALFYVPGSGGGDRIDEEWSAEIGNPVSAVMLGESSGEFGARGTCPINAVANLLEKLKLAAA